MRKSLTLTAFFAALLLVQGAAFGACIADQHEGFVCGEGKDAMRALPETISPSRKFAFAWHSSDGISGKEFSPDDVENVLIRLEDGQVLAKLGGNYWDTGEWRANRYGSLAIWSPDSHGVVEVANSRWDTDSFAYYAIDGASVGKVDLRTLVDPAMRSRLPAGRRDGQSFRVREDLPIKIDSRGHLRFIAMLFVPKSEDSFDFQIEVGITARKSGAPVARIASLKRIKLDPRL
jgi:hypothetical protein